MKKKITALFAAACLSITAVPAALAADADVTVTINGETQSFDQGAIIMHDRTMVPLRGIFVALGASVSWDEAARKVTAEKSSTKIELVIDSSKAYVNSAEKELDSPAVIVNDRTLVPARFVSEALGATVDWNADTRTVSISTKSTSVSEALKKMDAQFTKDSLDWVASLYDPETKGFYFARSSRDNEGFSADIEDTYFALLVLTGMGLQPRTKDSLMPEDFKNGLINFMLDRQDPDTGYFYDKQFGSNVGESKRGRNLSQAQWLLERFGVKWRYPLPTERNSSSASQTADNSSLPSQYASEESFLAWLKSLDIPNNPYAMGNLLAAETYTIGDCGYRQIATDYLTEIQNKETGMWGDKLDMNAVNGAMKIAYVFDSEHPYPNIDKMFKSSLEVVKSTPPTTTAEIWNPLSLYYTVLYQYGGLSKVPAEIQDELNGSLAEIIDNAAESLKNFKQPDGGYSWSPEGSSLTSQDVVVGLALKEGDMNGMALAVNTYQYAYLLADVPQPALWADYFDDFYDKIANTKTPEKIPMKKGIDLNFDDEELDKAPSGWSVGAQGTVKVIKDPTRKNTNNNVLEIQTGNEDYTVAQTGLQSGFDFQKATYECSIYIDKASAGALFYNGFGDLKEWCLTATSDKVYISHRDDGNGVGANVGEMEFGLWYDFKIVYTPQPGDKVSIDFYLDDEKVGSSNTYYGMGTGAKPPATISRAYFVSFLSGVATMYIDNFKITIE